MKYEVTWTRTASGDRGMRAVFTIEASSDQDAIMACERYLRGATMSEAGTGPQWECNMVNTVQVQS